jgi:hypothetical protein
LTIPISVISGVRQTGSGAPHDICHIPDSLDRPSLGAVVRKSDGSQAELYDLHRVSDVHWTQIEEVIIRDVPFFDVYVDFPGLSRSTICLRANLRVGDIPAFVR